MANTTITIRTDKALKKEAQVFFDSIGISLSSAFNLFLNDVVRNRTFSVTVGKDEPFGTLYPMEYEDLPVEQQKTVDRLRAGDTTGFVSYKPLGDLTK